MLLRTWMFFLLNTNTTNDTNVASDTDFLLNTNFTNNTNVASDTDFFIEHEYHE